MTPRTAPGFSLIETLVAIVVVGVALAGLASVFGLGFARGADPLRQRQAIAIAEAYLEEILQKPYADPDSGNVCAAPEPNRALYDDACDYDALASNGCTAVSVACPLGNCACDQNGAPLDPTAGYQISVVVTQSGLGAPAVNALRASVRVRGPDGAPIELVGYKAQTP